MRTDAWKAAGSLQHVNAAMKPAAAGLRDCRKNESTSTCAVKSRRSASDPLAKMVLAGFPRTLQKKSIRHDRIDILVSPKNREITSQMRSHPLRKLAISADNFLQKLRTTRFTPTRPTWRSSSTDLQLLIHNCRPPVH